MKPYPYQQTCLQKLARSRQTGQSHALVVMATGLGKTAVAAFDVQNFLRQARKRVLFLSHQKEINSQSRQTFELILGPDYTYGNFYGDELDLNRVDILFASFQMMHRHRKVFRTNEFDYIIVDEAHHGPAPTFLATIEYFEPEFLLGLTATPLRSDDQDITEIFGDPIFELSLEDALLNGLLCQVKYSVMTDNIAKPEVLALPLPDIRWSMLDKTFFIPKRDEEIIRIIEARSAHIPNRRMIIFCASIAHALRLSLQMPSATTLNSKVTQKQRAARLADFKNGRIDTITTIDLFNEGIDIPEANVIVFLRSTQSKTVFQQQLGRGLRKHTTKESVLVLDFVANCNRLEQIDSLWHDIRMARISSSRNKAVPKSTEIMGIDIEGIEFTETAKRVLEILHYLRERPVRTSKYTRQEMNEQLRHLHRSLGKIPSTQDVTAAYHHGSGASLFAFRGEFQNLSNALNEAGILEQGWQEYTNDQLTQQVIAAAKRLKRPLRWADIEEAPEITVSAQTLQKRLGQLQALQEKLGIAKPRVGDSNAILMLKMLGRQLGHAPKVREVNTASKEGKCLTVDEYIARFGSFNRALIRAGFSVRMLKNMSDEFMLEKFIELSERLGRTPTRTDIEYHRMSIAMPSARSYIKRFGGLVETAELCNLLPNRLGGAVHKR